MEEIYTERRSNNHDEEIDLKELFYILMAGKWIIIAVTTFVSIIAVIYSLLTPNIYESRALLVPVNSSNSISGALGGYSNFAGLAGINLPSNSNENNTQQALEKIKSLSFFENNILKNINLLDLMAVREWNSTTNILAYDQNIFDTKSNTWVRDFSYPQQQIPSAQESFEIFKKEHLSLNEDKNSGFITLSIKHQSPFIAKQWTELIINEINDFYRLKDKLASEKSASYLNEKISLTSFSEIKQALAQLLQEETKKLALIEGSEFYVFDYIDTPTIMEKKSSPNRALICILGALLGGILGIVSVLIKYYFRESK
tara:strand:- start:18964 stop:19905 length:942 start_codon:yes stop_codon:yes gene_type:complete